MRPADSDRVVIPGSERAPLAGTTPTGAPDPNERATVTVVVRRRAQPPEASADTSTPPASRTYLTREAFAEQYGADPNDVAAVQRFAAEEGLSVESTDAARRSIVLGGTLGALSAAFGTTLHACRYQGDDLRVRSGALTVPAWLDGVIVGVFGLDNRPQARAHFRRATEAAAPKAVSYTPLQVAAAYDFPPGTDGTGQTIALIELGGGYVQSDLDAYFKSLSITGPAVSSVGVDGATNAPVGDPDSADAEVMLDIEVAGSVAPGAKFVVYFAPNTDQGFLDAVTTAIHDTTNKPTIVSISWGGPESSWTASAISSFDAAFADAATLGVTVCIASGDNGSSDGLSDGLAHVDFPSSSPHVLSCGGTTLHITANAVGTETVWNDGTQGGATGGGISDSFALPTWQTGAGVPPSANPGGRVGRGVPDVAGDADPATGYTTRVDGQTGAIGGTSAVAPLWSALIARVNQSIGAQAGFVNALLYAQKEVPFHDVTSGNNGAYAAGTGWDACTGLGSPVGANVLTALTPPVVQPPPPTQPPPTQPPPATN
jgi:kumamolisin